MENMQKKITFHSDTGMEGATLGKQVTQRLLLSKVLLSKKSYSDFVRFISAGESVPCPHQYPVIFLSHQIGEGKSYITRKHPGAQPHQNIVILS